MSGAAIQPMPFIAASPEEAVAQIRARLGPEAVVLNVRPVKPPGLARFWRKPMIEVVAYRPEPPAPPAPAAAPVNEALAGFRQELEEIRQQVELNNSGWRVAAILQKTGLLPLHTQHILDGLKSAHGEIPPPNLAEEIALARAQLAGNWRAPCAIGPNSMHVLIGPAGSGKSTVLCKWLTQTALVEGRLARLWRLDGATANTAEFLSVHGEALNAEVERCWTSGARALAEDIGFIDLPGVDWRNPRAIQELSEQLAELDSPHIHLVLNGAYDIKVLLAQARAFSVLPLEDLIISHLDEEPHWGKLWNLTLGAGLPIRHLSAGQNIPGDFWEASAERILARQLPGHRDFAAVRPSFVAPPSALPASRASASFPEFSRHASPEDWRAPSLTEDDTPVPEAPKTAFLKPALPLSMADDWKIPCSSIEIRRAGGGLAWPWQPSPSRFIPPCSTSIF